MLFQDRQVKWGMSWTGKVSAHTLYTPRGIDILIRVSEVPGVPDHPEASTCLSMPFRLKRTSDPTANMVGTARQKDIGVRYWSERTVINRCMSSWMIVAAIKPPVPRKTGNTHVVLFFRLSAPKNKYLEQCRKQRHYYTFWC